MATQTIIKITDHIARSQALLTEQYKKLPNFDALINIFSTQIQDLENVLYSFILNFDLTQAIGAQLDILGLIVGILRPPGTSDAAFRGLIFAKIVQNVSNGTRDNIINLLNTLELENIVIIKNTVAGIEIQYDRGTGLVSKSEVLNAIIKASLAIEIDLTERNPVNNFTWASKGRGFGIGVF